MNDQMLKAGKAGGNYLEKINKFDLMNLTKDEWNKFIEIICTEFIVPF